MLDSPPLMDTLRKWLTLRYQEGNPNPSEPMTQWGTTGIKDPLLGLLWGGYGVRAIDYMEVGLLCEINPENCPFRIRSILWLSINKFENQIDTKLSKTSSFFIRRSIMNKITSLYSNKIRYKQCRIVHATQPRGQEKTKQNISHAIDVESLRANRRLWFYPIDKELRFKLISGLQKRSNFATIIAINSLFFWVVFFLSGA